MFIYYIPIEYLIIPVPVVPVPEYLIILVIASSRSRKDLKIF
jgi:hypothetical protein